MNNLLKRIGNYDKLSELYSYNHFSIKSVLEYLEIWNSLTEEEKYHYENLTIADSFINGHKQNYINKISNFENESLGYGEISKKGVDSIYNYITKYLKEEETVFYDIGSGNGKLIIHLSLISNFKSLIGVEIDKFRHLYSQKIMSNISTFENVEFINKDVLDLDLSIANVIFMNDTLFPKNLIEEILKKLKKGTHLISLEENSLKKVGEILIDVSWMDIPLEFKHYII